MPYSGRIGVFMKIRHFVSFVSIVLVTIMVLGCVSTEKVVDPNAESEKVFDIELSKDEIYDSSLQFIAENFRSAKSVLEYQDRNAGRIIGNGSTNISDGLMDRPATFTMTIDIRDNRYRITFRNLQYQPGTQLPWGSIEYKVPYDNMVRNLNSLADRLHSYLLNSKGNLDF
jgi:hypothetical protein